MKFIDSIIEYYSSPSAEIILKRNEYKKIKDPIRLWLLLFVALIILSILLFIFNIKAIAFFCLIISLSIIPILYLNIPRNCPICKGKMKRYINNDLVNFCCDNCKTKFNCIIGVGDTN